MDELRPGFFVTPYLDVRLCEPTFFQLLQNVYSTFQLST